MMKLLQAAVLFAALATSCLAAHHRALETYSACVDHSIPETLKNKSVSELKKQYTAHLMTTNASMPDRQEITILNIISHALNATGNASETMSRLGINRIGCVRYLQLTLIEAALLNLKNPDKFPGNMNVKDLFDLLLTNRTEIVLRRVQFVITENFKNKTHILNQTIAVLIETSPFTNETDLLQVLRYATNASSDNQTAKELDFPMEYLREPMITIAEYLFVPSAHHFQEFFLERVIQRLLFSQIWLSHLNRFKKLERMKVQNKTMNELFEEKGLDKKNTTLLSLFEEIFPTDPLNWTLVKFFGMHRVLLENFNFTLYQWKEITYLGADALGNSSLLETFAHAFVFAPVFQEYRMNIKLAKSRKEMILGKYNVTRSVLMEPPYSLSFEYFDALGERELESYSIRVHLVRYADGRNITFEELENLSNITKGQLTNATVDNFVPILFKIAQSNVIRAITKESALTGIVTNLTPLCFENLKTQIQNKWQPLTIDWIKGIKISISYYIFQAKLNPQSVLNMTFYNFFENHLSYESISFRDLLKLFSGTIYQNHVKLEREFKNYTFGQLETYIGLKQFEIFSWTLDFFIKHISMGILNDINECNRNPRPCAMITGVTCSNRIFGYKCNCPGEMNLDKNKGCRDINECSIWSHRCNYPARCMNTPGSYKCVCPAGYNVSGDEFICADIDECQQGTAACPINSGCNNTIGSYICTCNKGFQKDDNRCEDINECRLGTATCRNNSRCDNTIGSYRCPCNRGFENVNDTCQDIDECKRSDRTCFIGTKSIQCNNTIGSFTCVCNPGYRFNHDYRICRDINECVEQMPCSSIVNSKCKNGQGTYECTCPPGFKKHVDVNGTLVNCTDIDECANRSCDQNAVCNNTVGSYSCRCKEGYKGDGVECKAAQLYQSPPGIVATSVIISTKLRAPTKFYYNQRMHDTIRISEDGFIVIGNKKYWSSPKTLTSLNKDVVAPFWSSTASYSSVTYFTLEQGDARASSLLNKINQFVTNSTNETDFSASWVIVVTWDKVNPYWYSPSWWPSRNSPYVDETNTFQVVIAVQRKTTFVHFLYEDMKWRIDRGRKAVVGYSTKSRNNGYQVPVSFKPDIFRIDERSFTDPAGNVRKGCIVNLFKEQTQQEPSPEEKCLEWIQKESKKDNDWISDLPRCPCDRNTIQFDVRFRRWLIQPVLSCYVTRRTSFSTMCCYDDSGALLSSPDSRAGRAFRYGPTTKNYYKNEVEPYQWCCSLSNRYCEDFSQLRPSSESFDVDPDVQYECSRCRLRFGFRWSRPRRRRRWMRVLRRGFTWGDPHITTVDGFKYTFNGLGDYVMLKTNDAENFNAIHTRTKRAKNKSGGLSKATVFSGFALRSSKNTTVQVFFDSSVDGNLSITTVNRSMNCQTFGLPDIDKHQIDGFILVNNSNTLVVIYDSGLTVEITPGLDLLQFSISIPTSKFENRTAGLLGKLNEDANDDLILRNGTMVSIKSTDKEIFAYGNDWEVKPDERLFVNSTSCQKMDVFTTNFEPIFLTDVSANITNEMRNACRGNKECLLDFFATGDSLFARATLDFETQNEKIKKIFDNRPPSIVTSPEEPLVTVGQMATVTVTVSDPDNDTITELLAHGLSGLNATFNNDTSTAGILTWTPSPDLDTVNIRFIAKDSNGAATSHNLIVRYCDCKNNGNICKFETIQKTYANSSLSLVECNCTEEYTGEQCETEVKPCDDKPCFNDNVTCNVTRNPFGSQCGPCPKGLEGDGKICNDYDECLIPSRNNCTEYETCSNTIGSYKCECKKGYSRDSDSQKCLDVNECNEKFLDSYKCKANTDCENTLGSYNCSCKKGYKGDPLTGCTDINECQGDDQICFSPTCENSIGSFNCSCSTGFELKKQQGNNLFCQDKDECKYPADNNCEQTCVNNEGSYACACKPGYELAGDGHSCVVKNSSKCDSTNGGCQRLCTNSSGIVTCSCPRGFNLSSDGKNCEDVDECKSNNGGCSQKCDNNVGNYRCACHSGYVLKGATSCEEIDECLVNNGDCDQKCDNKPGGHDCSCKKGFVLKASDNKTCEDINECTSNVNKCDQYRVCKNTPGGYSCNCRDQSLFSNGKFQCRRSRKFIFGFTMLMPWMNDYDDEYSDNSIQLRGIIVQRLAGFFGGKFKAYLGCRVVGKFRRGSIQTNVTLNFDDNSTVSTNDVNNAVKNVNVLGGIPIDPSKSAVSDVNECSDPSLNNCHKNATCTNEPGTFSCKCKDGLTGDGISCGDLNECSDPSLNNCHKNATCKNEPGTFSCKCKDGFTGDGISCKESVIPEKKGGDDDDNKVMIILLCTLIPLAVIIIIVIIVCCCYRRRKSKQTLYVENPAVVQMYHTRSTYGPSNGVSRENYYDNAHRKGSDDSSDGAGDYDIAQPPSTFGKQGSSEMYDVSQAQYYDNPAAVSAESQH